MDETRIGFCSKCCGPIYDGEDFLSFEEDSSKFAHDVCPPPVKVKDHNAHLGRRGAE